MPKYKVDVIETKSVFLTFEVIADDREDAEAQVLHGIIDPIEEEEGDGECFIDDIILIEE